MIQEECLYGMVDSNGKCTMPNLEFIIKEINKIISKKKAHFSNTENLFDDYHIIIICLLLSLILYCMYIK